MVLPDFVSQVKTVLSSNLPATDGAARHQTIDSLASCPRPADGHAGPPPAALAAVMARQRAPPPTGGARYPMTPRLQVCAQDDLVQPARPGVLGYRALVRDPLRPLHIPSRRHVHAVHGLTDLPVDDLPVTRPQVGIAHTYDMGDIPDHTHHPQLS